MSAFLASVLISLGAFFGVSAPAPAAAPAPAPTATASAPAAAQDCYEDQPCWDCATMGNKHCADSFEKDAWESLDSVKLEAPKDGHKWKIDYVGYSENKPNANVSRGEFAVMSETSPDLFYTFKWTMMQDA